MIVTLTPTHIACLSLGLSCEWGTFFVDSTIRDQWVKAVGRQRLVVNCEQSVMRYNTWRWHALSGRLLSADPVVMYPFLDWVRAHQLSVKQWVIDGKDPFRYSRRLRWMLTLLVIMGGVGWVGYHRVTPPPPPPRVVWHPLRLTELFAMLAWVRQQDGVVIGMGSTPQTAHLSALIPAPTTVTTAPHVIDTPLTAEWKGIEWQVGDD